MKTDTEILDWLSSKRSISFQNGELMVDRRYVGNPYDHSDPLTLREAVQIAMEGADSATPEQK